MRIALVITELDPGGAERCLANLAVYLHNLGHQVRVLAFGPVPKERIITDILDAAGVQWKCGGWKKSTAAFSAWRWLRKELQAFQPDVLQSMLVHANILSHFSAPAQTAHFCGVRVKPLAGWLTRIESIALHGCKHVICVSQGVADACCTVQRLDANRLSVIPNGIANKPLATPLPENFPSALRGNDDSPASPYLLFVGRLAKQKNVLQLLKHSDQLLQKLPYHHLVFVGDGPQRNEVEKEAKACTETRRIHITGWSGEAENWIANCDLLLLPTLYEGMPNVILEAMAHGRPFAAFDVEGISELIPKGTDSVQAIEPENWKAYLEAVVKIASDDQLKSQCSQANRKQISAKFSLEDQLKRYPEIWDRFAR